MWGSGPGGPADLKNRRYREGHALRRDVPVARLHSDQSSASRCPPVTGSQKNIATKSLEDWRDRRGFRKKTRTQKRSGGEKGQGGRFSASKKQNHPFQKLP